MIRWVLRRAIDKFERDWNYDASYMRDMIDASPRAAWLFSRVATIGTKDVSKLLVHWVLALDVPSRVATVESKRLVEFAAAVENPTS